MKLPNPLASRWGRLIAFFFLYVTEGIPYGFATTAIVSHLRDQGHSEKELGYFSGIILLPWAFKWAVGPFVDLIFSDRLGRRRGWIVGCQVLMAVSLLACIPIDTSGGLYALTIALTIHNCFSATQDVAIDALACGTLKSDERGLANGLMFAGAYAGQMVGASVVLHLMGGVPWLPGLEEGIPFESTFWVVSASILTVTITVSLSLREQPTESAGVVGASFGQAGAEVKHYLAEAFRSVFANRTSILALIICLLPAGALFLGMQLHTALAKRLAYTNTELANLAFFSTVIPCICCVIGGYLSDKIGRRLSLGVYILLTIVPTLWMASTLYFELGWEDFGSRTATSPTTIPDSVKSTFWNMVLLHSAIQGLIYGTRIAMFMDIANPEVAGTQFTAYMAMQNIVLSYTAMWQGEAITRYGYPMTLLIDCGIGIVAILLLPFLDLSGARKSNLTSPTSHMNQTDTQETKI
ncbi:MAG: MFS transporter [Planctomycetota bacterium]|nr:MFS transporter [Planctomycetota bacterium]MDA1248083.1 MFS transporter [Planctomycetota bacterium]